MKVDSETEIAKRLLEMNQLIKDLKYEEALDRFYDEGIITCENESEPIKGLLAYKEAGRKFLVDISDYSAELLHVTVIDGISATEWRYKFNHKMAGVWDRKQVSVQRWSNGKIIHERHYYST